MTSPFLGSTSPHSRQVLRGKRYQRLSRDLYVLGPADLDVRVRAVAVRLVLDDAVPCLWTAALLQHLPVDDDGLLHVARPPGGPRSRRPGVRVHRYGVDDDELLDLDGLPVTDGPRTFVDLARYLPAEALVAVGDVVVRRYGAAAVERAVARRRKRKGIVLAREVLPLLDGGAASPAESRTRLRLHAAGFTSLRHGVVVTDEDGQWLAEPDLADPVARVAVQYDGAVHFLDDPRQRQQDVERDELTRQAGWEVVVATARDDRRPDLLVQKVAGAYQRAAERHGRAVLPPWLR